MGNTKNKKSTKKSSKVHVKNPVKRLSKRMREKERDRKMFLVLKRSILSVIALAMLTVILALLLTSFTEPERVVTSKIEGITADYYENYFYDRISDYDLEKYADKGFSKVTLRQLLLFDSERHVDAMSLLSQYCDIEATYVRIYPEKPFSKTDYHVEYNYACTF